MGEGTQEGDEEIMPENSMILSAEQQDAYRLDAELKHNAQSVVGGIIEIGRCLKEINDRKLYEHLGYNGLAAYAVASVGLRERAAYNYITAYETYGADGLQKYGQLGITKLVALAQLNEEDRTEMLESGKAEELSTRKLSDEIKKLKGENDQLRIYFASELEDRDADIDGKNKEIEDLKKRLEEAQRPVVASMTDEEKEEIRREAEKTARAEADKEVERWKSMKEKDAKTYEKAIKEYQADAEAHEKQIKNLEEQLETVKAAAPAPAPAPTGNKELLKYHFEALKTAYVGAVEVLERFDANEREKYKTALIKIAGDIKSAAENM